MVDEQIEQIVTEQIVTRKAFFETNNVNGEDLYSRLFEDNKSPSYKKMSKDDFLKGNIFDILTVPGAYLEMEDVGTFLRIGPDETHIELRLYLAVDSKVKNMSVEEIIKQYVFNFDVHGYAEQFNLNPKDEAEMKTKIDAMQARYQHLKPKQVVVYDVVNGPEKIKLALPAKPFFAVVIGATKEDDGTYMIRENRLDLVQKIDQDGGMQR